MAAVQQLLDCMVSSWYPRFARATFKTVLVPLPQPVLDWLVADGLHLPEDTQAVGGIAGRGTDWGRSAPGQRRGNWRQPPPLVSAPSAHPASTSPACSLRSAALQTSMQWRESTRMSGARARARRTTAAAQRHRSAGWCCTQHRGFCCCSAAGATGAPHACSQLELPGLFTPLV